MKKNTNTNKIWKKPEFYFIGILAILMIVLITQIAILQIIPLKYTLMIFSIMALIFLGLWFLEYNRHISKMNRNLGKVIIVVLSILLCVANFYVYKGGLTLSNISGATIKTDAISVIVMKDYDAENGELEKLADANFGILKIQDRENTNHALDKIKDELDKQATTIEYNSIFDLAEALYAGDVDSIVLNEAYRGSFEDNEDRDEFKSFDSETKIIYQVEIESDLIDISKNVDVTKSPFNVFISGIDTYGSVSATSRSDVNMLASINPTTKQILLTSIPRDYYVAQSCQGGQMDKLTHAGIFGVECSVDAIENLLNIDINYYARVNFSSLVNIVDALGGITVDNPTGFVASDGTYSYPQGSLQMDGAMALRFSRERYAFAEGDRERGKNQMRVITGIIDKAISPTIITNYTGVMNAISGSFQTNMESSDITRFVQKQLNDMSGWDVIQNSVNGQGGTDWTPANGFNAYVMYPDQTTVDHASDLIQKLMNNEMISSEE